MQFVEPLSDLEYEQLDQFLQSDLLGPEAMDVSMLDGFITAMAVAPMPAPPMDQWLPLVWGCKNLSWESTDQAQWITNLIMRHYHAIAELLSATPEAIDPLLSYRRKGDQEIAVLDNWCQGFVCGIELSPETWRPLLEDDASEGLLLPIMLYGTEAGWRRLDSSDELASRHDEFVSSLASNIRGIHDFWKKYRRALEETLTLRYEQAPPGRNDPCPCGSGKKFKKCCGA